jgi:cytochrome P450
MFDAAFRRDPYPLYEQLRAAGRVHHLAAAGAWMVLGYDAVKRVLTDHESFSSAAAGGQPGKWLIFQDPPRHTKLRALIGRAFTPRSIAALEPRIEALVDELLRGVEEREELDVVTDLAVPLPLVVIAELLGAPSSDHALFRAWSETLLRLVNVVTGGDAAERATRDFAVTTREMSAYLDELLAPRRTAPRDDLLSRLLHAEVDGERLAPEDLLGFFQLLLLAGHETTTNLVGNAVLSFLDHPAELARVRESPALLPSAIEEVLRHRSPVQASFRVTTRAVEIDGYVIPEGAMVLAMIGAAHRDPDVFVDPARFDVTRSPSNPMAFGHGIHFCIGAPLARLEARVALTHLLARTGDLAYAGDGPWEPREAFHVHGPTRLPVRFTKRRG